MCHACGWACTNPHPSAKQRRSHRKHCGKSAAAAAAEGGRRVSDEELSDEDRRKKVGKEFPLGFFFFFFAFVFAF